MITATLYSDPACPWAYSESPALRVIEWRYGDQLDWKLVLVGLTESSEQYAKRGYTPVRGALGQLHFRSRYGMPFAPEPKARLSATARACRAVVATRMSDPGTEWGGVPRAIQLANFNGPLVLEDDDMLRDVLREVPGVDADAIVAALDSPEVTAAYEADKAATREAAGSAAELQGRPPPPTGPFASPRPRSCFSQTAPHWRPAAFVAGRGLRHPRDQPRSDAHPLRAARDARAAVGRVSRRAHDPGGRGADDPRQRRARPPGGRGRAHRAGSRWEGGTTVDGRRRALDHGLGCRPGQPQQAASPDHRSPTAFRTPPRCSSSAGGDPGREGRDPARPAQRLAQTISLCSGASSIPNSCAIVMPGTPRRACAGGAPPIASARAPGSRTDRRRGPSSALRSRGWRPVRGRRPRRQPGPGGRCGSSRSPACRSSGGNW